MATLQCPTCGGIYDDLMPDETRYFHVCPPLSREEFDAAVANGTIVLRKDETADQAFTRRSWPRPNARDENVDPVKAAAARTPAGALLPGKTAADVQKAPGAAPIPVADAEADHV